MIATTVTAFLVGAVLVHGSPRPGDSARVVRDVRNAQRDFERFRRDRLPIGDAAAGTCDVRVGRYCYWRGDDDDEEDDPPPESASILARRDALIHQLDRAAYALPGDSWIAGQRVRYLVEAKRFDDALRAATTDCRASTSWCDAIAGYAAQRAQRYALADSLFTSALAAMPEAERCRWLDMSDELSDELHGPYERLDCPHREQFGRRVYWMGAPLYLVSTTDLRTEHLSRLVFSQLASQSATAEGDSWGDDERELGERYGWPTWFTRAEPRIALDDLTPEIIGHDPGQPYYFLPSARALEHVSEVSADDWQLNDPRARSGYAPLYARSMHALPHQIARFRRGDSTLVVGAWDASADTTLLGRQLLAGVTVVDDGTVRAAARDSVAGVTGRLMAAGMFDSGLVSVELLAEHDRRAARARIGIVPRPAGQVAVSDLLLLAGDSTSSETVAGQSALVAVVGRALTSERIPPNRIVDVYWEIYGVPAGESVHYTISVQPVDVGLMRQLAARLRFSDPASGFRIEWHEVPRPIDGIAARTTRLDVTRLRGGRYRVELDASVSGAPTASAVATFAVR